MFGLDKTKELADKVQASYEGQKIDNQLGTNNVAAPVDTGIEDFNKGTEFGIPHQNHYITEGIIDNIKKKFGKKKEKEEKPVKKEYKTGTFRVPVADEDLEEPRSFIKPEADKARKERYNEERMKEAAYHGKFMQAKELGIDPVDYERLLHYKKNDPENFDNYTNTNQRVYGINKDDILDVPELIEKFKTHIK